MRILDALKTSRPTLSFEFYPPKSDIGFWDLFKTIESLKPIDPTYVSVTYGAGGSTRGKTVDLVARIKRDIGIESMAHITCVGATRDEIAEVLDSLKSHGLENVLALRGDAPAGEDAFVATAGGFTYANELVEFIRDRFDFCIGAACYPECHPEAANPDVDLENLKRKVDAGVDFLITQLFFNNDDFFAFRDKCQAVGIDVPIVPGLMPVTNLSQIQRISSMCGAKLPKAFLAPLAEKEDDADWQFEVGVEQAAQQAEGLLSAGVPGMHFYVLNRSKATSRVLDSLDSFRQ